MATILNFRWKSLAIFVYCKLLLKLDAFCLRWRQSVLPRIIVFVCQSLCMCLFVFLYICVRVYAMSSCCLWPQVSGLNCCCHDIRLLAKHYCKSTSTGHVSTSLYSTSLHSTQLNSIQLNSTQFRMSSTTCYPWSLFIYMPICWNVFVCVCLSHPRTHWHLMVICASNDKLLSSCLPEYPFRLLFLFVFSSFRSSQTIFSIWLCFPRSFDSCRKF